MAAVRFLNPEVVLSQPWIEVSRRNLAWHFHLLKQIPSLKPYPKVDFWLYGRYLDVNRQFQAKTAKYKNRNISKTIHRINNKFEDRADTDNCTSWVVWHYKSNMAAGRHLADVITYAKFQVEIFRGYDFTGGRISHFPIDFCMGLTTVQRDCAACDMRLCWNSYTCSFLSLFAADVFRVACLHHASRSLHFDITVFASSICNNSHPCSIAQSILILNMFSQ